MFLNFLVGIASSLVAALIIWLIKTIFSLLKDNEEIRITVLVVIGLIVIGLGMFYGFVRIINQLDYNEALVFGGILGCTIGILIQKKTLKSLFSYKSNDSESDKDDE